MKRLAWLVVLAGCGSSASVPAVRFANAPAVDVVNDRRHVAKEPKERVYERYLKHFDGSFHRRVTNSLELKRHERARGVNALDEVPDSTWFTNRIGVRDVPRDDLIVMPGSIGSPEAHKPWTIVSSKVGGLTVGFIIKDARGEKYLLKFDPKGLPEAETATQIVIGRLLWALGYNVTDDHVVYISKSDLVLAPDAKVKDPSGASFPLDERELAARLARVDVGKNGTMRALLSRYLDGKPLGGHGAEGVRADDPNDLIPHELRRDLRGTAAIFAWLDSVDLHLGNSLDMYVQDPVDPKRNYVKHYFIDYGIGLGFGATKNSNLRYGYEYELDWKAMARSLLTLGLIQRPWESRTAPPYRGVGLLDIDHYNPGRWKPLSPMYTPVRIADRFDKFWGAKLIMKLRREHIEAAVEAAKLSDPRASQWLVDALLARQRKTAQYWFMRVAPIDEVSMRRDQLCFKDLSIAYGFEPAHRTRYALTFHDARGERLAARQVAAALGGVTCSPTRLSDGHHAYTVVRIDTQRPGFKGTTYIHVARDPRTLVPRVIGLWRE
jgi:hypothetical protein